MRLVKCACCGVQFDPAPGPKGGRPRKYCAPECRVRILKTVYQPAYQKRRADKIRSVW